ncbi:helix-turn-helix domain-containing protein [Thalassobellus citreus]|uniref:helix-turn-helix domain-containing protein n=1 Tax=Thalassobellus citreus TaxID=3367752 RepID=UPI0037A3A1F2
MEIFLFSKTISHHVSVDETAFELGFKHYQSFSKLFKSKTNTSPSKFRASFN